MHFKSKTILILISLMMLVSMFDTSIYADETFHKESSFDTETNLEDNYLLKIDYCIEGTNIQIAPSYSASLIKGSEYNVKSPEIKDYTICNKNENAISGTINKDEEITVYYQLAHAMVPYKILYIGREYDGSNEIILEETTCEGIAESKVIVEPKEFDGYLLDPGDMTFNIAEDGSTVKKVYYSRKTLPTIIFDTGLGADTIQYISAEPGTDISTLVSKIENPKRQGYIFDKWDCKIPSIMPNEDLIIKAIWKPGNSSYVVQYFFENANDNGYTRNKGLDESRMAVTNTIVAANQEDIDKADETKAVSYEEYKKSSFFGFDYDRCEPVKATSDGKGVLKIFYKREIWKIELMNNLVFASKYGTTRDEFEAMSKSVWKEYEGKYGSNVPSDFPTRDQIVEHTLELNKNDNSGYSYRHKKVGSFQDVSDDSFSKNDPYRLKKPKWREFTKFVDEDTDHPGSHVVHGYPTMIIDEYTFDMRFMLEKLDSSGNDKLQDFEFIPELSKTTIPLFDKRAKTKFPYVEGFVYDGAYVQSYYDSDEECCDKKWVMPFDWNTSSSADRHDAGCGNPYNITEVAGWNNELQAVKIPDKYISKINFMPKQSLYLGVHTTFYLKRARNDIELHVGNELVQTIEDVPFGKLLKDIKIVTDGDNDKLNSDCFLTDYVPSNVPEGYKFAGWSVSNGNADADGNMLIDDASTMPSTKLNLYAIWEPIKSIVKVSFDSTGGSLVNDQNIAFNSKASKPENPIKKGFKFINWYYNGTVYNFNSEVKDDLTLHAVWQPLDLVEYHVYHKIEGTEEIIAEKVGKGVIGNEVLVSALGVEECGATGRNFIVPDKSYKTIVLEDNSDNNLTFYYHISGVKNYTVSYLLENTDKKLSDDLVVKNTQLSAVTEKAIDIDGYHPLQKYITASLSEGTNNHIVFYYSDEPVNPVDPSPTTINITAQVLMNGVKPQGEQFVFVLADQNKTVLQNKHAINGNIYFDELVFDEPGEYIYKIYEKKGTDGDIDYDENIYTLVAKVELDEDANALLLETTIKKNGKNHFGDIVFINKNKSALPDNSNQKNNSKNNVYIPNTSTKRK